MSAPKLLLQMWKGRQHGVRCLPFQPLQQSADRHLRRDRHKQVHVVHGTSRFPWRVGLVESAPCDRCASRSEIRLCPMAAVYGRSMERANVEWVGKWVGCFCVSGAQVVCFVGRRGWTRTSDHLLRRHPAYLFWLQGVPPVLWLFNKMGSLLFAQRQVPLVERIAF